MTVPMAVLGLLAEGPHHGYDVKHRYDRLLAPDKPLQFGQVYATLSRLERDGRVVVASRETGGGPERKVYAATPTGRRELTQWLQTPEPPMPYLHAMLFTKVVLTILVGGSVERFLEAQRHAHLERMRELTARRRRAPLTEALLADYALFHLEADLRWIELTSRRIEELRRSVVDADEPIDSERSERRAR